MLVLTSKLPHIKKGIIAILCCASSALYADIRIEDSLGEKVFAEAPTRVASLNWELTENVIELGVEPIAVADMKGYEEWVTRPALPASSQDIGDRAEPNLEKLAQLKPDVILIGAALEGIKSRLEKIAPVVFFNTYQKDHNNAEAADRVFLTIATLLDKQDIATEKLTNRAKVLNQLKAKLEAKYPEGMPKVASMRFANTTSAYVYGKNAMPEYALNALGIDNALSLKNTQWGVTQKKIKFLRSVDDNVLLYFQPFYEEEKLNASPLWKAMPFVQQGKVAPIASTWTYGGAMSLQYLAEAMTDALLSLPNENNTGK
ncbi:iron-siderophore ABC transporter substrate-binding protein [Marinomonas sp. 2405UD66-6]|uniref:iron-siderophore ABC transporter substrate-binding protein n=1 Tax=Marinomonas sp. 2405UD66-6 TaxID=3391834 RepID=UPI0039C8C9FA